MSLQSLLRPESIAVVGASSNSFVGSIALNNSRRLDYQGRLVPIHRGAAEIAGIATVASVRELQEVPDLVMVQVRTSRVLEVVEEALGAGVRNFVIPGGGITDSGQDAVALDEGLRAMRLHTQFNVVGPNSMGLVDLVSGAAPYVGTVPTHVRRGSVAVVAQSGAVVELVVNAGGRVPFSTVVSTGAESATSMADYIDFFREDPHTNSLLVFIEGFEEPAEFLAAARRFVAEGKALAATFVGRSATSRDGISAHSGKLAPSARVTAAALRQAGIVLADDLDEFLTMGEIFGTDHIPSGNRVHFVTNSGGEGNLLADLAEDAGLVLPPMSDATVAGLNERWPNFKVRNPLDPWGVDDYELVYPAAIQAAAAEPGDILVVSQDQQQTSGDHERELGLNLARYLASARVDGVSSILLSPTSQDPHPEITTFCRANQITHLRGARAALNALGKLTSITPTLPSVGPLVPVDEPLLAKQTPLTEDEALSVLNSLGVRVPAQLRVESPADAVAAARSLRSPVVVKGVAETLWHKSDLGLVAVGLNSEDAVHSAACQILANAEGAGVEVDLLVAEMARGDLDVFVGYKRDDQFGHTILLGLGGIWTEKLDVVDVFVGLLDDDLAKQWIPTTRIGRMLEGARGGAIPTDDLVTALVAVSRLVNHDENVAAVDINPVMVGSRGGVAVDASIQRTTDI